jgi:hypothetical protein
MISTLLSLVCAASLTELPKPSPLQPNERSYLYQPAFSIDYQLRQPAELYRPQAGDLFLCTGREMWAKLGHYVAFAQAPQHSGIVVALPNGRLGLLEAGPHNTLHCEIEDLIPQLQSYAEFERVWIRQRKVPLTPEQSARLTEFALSKVGTRFALWRMFAQLTPFRSRGPLRTEYLGCSGRDRWGYFCAELAMEACVAAGLLDADTARPAATYPRDIFFGRSRNPYIDQHLDLSNWYPPARWTLFPGMEPPFKSRYPILDGDMDA